ncbi:TIGR01777 family oxidoreductase [Sporosarcina thermotolerans]|uniref:TIGR01777 family oxidoreductase n=1 Tax=Sporosarcina thermotolerans TaxID=633404 RepID=A0AAW9AEF5_9BACL|nr:TIGR01777 family oxidoreductase [Sporosarcina thermotolerans]MDW0117528.1 TIGR01777 family oxidoreductase [Sporosarcina thermotolerans]WHT49692.1 TIGR01777 family oxidoreductase [Sporosarcina thermotolerans]
MKIVIAGGTGFIGNKLIDLFLQEGHEVIVLTRKVRPSSNNLSYVVWLEDNTSPEKEIGNADVFINLAGVSINDGRWTEKHQKQIYDSRMVATYELLRIISEMPQKPSVFINASAIGIYPVSLNNVYTEDSTDMPDDFLGRTVHDWEKKAKRAEEFGIRTVFMRFGVVLGNDGGALPLMALPYKLFAGGTVGSGKQWVSWIHVVDVVRAILFAVRSERLRGPVNVTAPFPLRMKEFGKTIGSVLGRPHWIPAPSIAMRMALGQKSKLVLEGQKVLPKVLLEKGFDFEFPKLESALRDLLT